MRMSEAQFKAYQKKQKRPTGKKQEKAAGHTMTEAQARYYAREAAAWAVYEAEEDAARRECVEGR